MVETIQLVGPSNFLYHHLAVKVPGSAFPQMGMWMGSVPVNNDHHLLGRRRDSVAEMETVSDHVALAVAASAPGCS